MKFQTLLAQLGNRSEATTGAVSVPIQLSTAYRHQTLGHSTGFDYTRTGNPTRKVLEAGIAALEEGSHGFAFSSGMAAVQALMHVLKPGDHIIASKDLYGGTYRLFETMWKPFGITTSYCTFHDYTELEAVIQTQRPRALFIESPTNPLMQEVNLQEVIAIGKQHGLLVIVDNTFYTPYIQKPLTLGADIILHSASKYLGGHNDVLAGLIVVKDEQLATVIGQIQNGAGAVLSPFDSYLLIRGMKTLVLRMKQHEENARKIATYLQNHDEVKDVLYPGRGGMLSFRVKNEHSIATFLENLSLVSFAESLGGCESFITYPATQTHADVPEEVRIANGVCNGLLRFSVGLEDVDDIVVDLERAFSVVKTLSTTVTK